MTVRCATEGEMPAGGLYALAIFGLFAAICVRETPVAVAQQPVGATAD